MNGIKRLLQGRRKPLPSRKTFLVDIGICGICGDPSTSINLTELAAGELTFDFDASLGGSEHIVEEVVDVTVVRLEDVPGLDQVHIL